MDSFCTAITAQTIDKIAHINIQPNRAFTVSSPSTGMEKSERVNIIKNINAHIKKSTKFEYNPHQFSYNPLHLISQNNICLESPRLEYTNFSWSHDTSNVSIPSQKRKIPAIPPDVSSSLSHKSI